MLFRPGSKLWEEARLLLLEAASEENVAYYFFACAFNTTFLITISSVLFFLGNIKVFLSR